MNVAQQRAKAERLLALHLEPKLLVLPNIWDPLGAGLLQALGYPAVATASAAVAYSLGYDDGQRITFDAMLDVIARIANAVEVPVSADIESGYADDPEALGENIRRVLEAGAVGINLEDSVVEGGVLRPIGAQCERLRAARAAADDVGVPLVINARTDVFLRADDTTPADRLAETIERARAYRESGADCIYPIPVGDLETLGSIQEAVDAPLNVYASGGAAPMKSLEAAGIARLSLGPGLLKATLATMKKVAVELQSYGSYGVFTRDAPKTEEVLQYVRKGRMHVHKGRMA